MLCVLSNSGMQENVLDWQKWCDCGLQFDGFMLKIYLAS